MSIPIVSVPNVKTGDVFYIYHKKKFLAVRIKKSYIDIRDRSVICNLEFPKGIEIPFGTSINKCKISLNCCNGERYLNMCEPYDFYKVSVFPRIYETLDDARNGIAYKEEIDLYSLPCHTNGFKSIDLTSREIIQTMQWGYLTKTLVPTTIYNQFKYAEFYEDGYRLLKDDLTPEPDCYFKSLSEVEECLNKKLMDMEVVDFENKAPKKEEKKTISVEITKNTTALELAEKIIAESKGTWK